jgi:hypothetical protein
VYDLAHAARLFNVAAPAALFFQRLLDFLDRLGGDPVTDGDVQLIGEELFERNPFAGGSELGIFRVGRGCIQG